jgi:hypothetical protein
MDISQKDGEKRENDRIFADENMAISDFVFGEETVAVNILRRDTHTGRPCGSAGFIEGLERLLNRALRPKKTRPPSESCARAKRSIVSRRMQPFMRSYTERSSPAGTAKRHVSRSLSPNYLRITPWNFPGHGGINRAKECAP